MHLWKFKKTPVRGIKATIVGELDNLEGTTEFRAAPAFEVHNSSFGGDRRVWLQLNMREVKGRGNKRVPTGERFQLDISSAELPAIYAAIKAAMEAQS